MPEDLLDKSNKECCICLDDHEIGETVCRLPCGHIFHRSCVFDWLRKHCTCPSCRYELETSDKNFEAGRVDRMKNRKFRLRMRELEISSVSQLRSLASDIGVPTINCIEKSDLINCLVDSNRVEILTTNVPEYSREQLNSMGIREIYEIMKIFGVEKSGCFEKGDLIAKLENSGRILVVEDETVDESAPSHKADQQNGSEIPLIDLPLKNLREIMKNENIDVFGCIDKEDLVRKITEHRER